MADRRRTAWRRPAGLRCAHGARLSGAMPAARRALQRAGICAPILPCAPLAARSPPGCFARPPPRSAPMRRVRSRRRWRGDRQSHHRWRLPRARPLQAMCPCSRCGKCVCVCLSVCLSLGPSLCLLLLLLLLLLSSLVSRLLFFLSLLLSFSPPARSSFSLRDGVCARCVCSKLRAGMYVRMSLHMSLLLTIYAAHTSRMRQPRTATYRHSAEEQEQEQQAREGRSTRQCSRCAMLE